MSLRKFQHQFPVVKNLTVGQEKPRKEPLGAGEDENKTRDKMHEVGKDVANNENKGDVTDPSGAGEDEKKTRDKIDEVGKDVSNNENKGDVTDPFGAGEDEKKSRGKIHEVGEDISNNENKGDINDRNVHNEILFSCLNYFHENKLTRTLHTLEQEAQIFFNQNHVDEMIKEGKWDESLYYLSAFSGIDDDRLVEILYQVALQKFKEELRRKSNDISANCDSLKFDDARGMLRANIKKMVEKSEKFRDKMKFPKIKRLYELFSEKSAGNEDPTIVLSPIQYPPQSEHIIDNSQDVIGSDIHGVVNKFTIFKKELGYGYSTIVREGLFDGRPVAIKCLLIHFSELMTTEVECLIQSDSHQNIVQYYGKDSDHNFHYLALEKCSFSLYDLITNKVTFENDEEYTLWNKQYPSPFLLSIMRQIVSGLQHLHSLGIVHRDLKPTNIMMKKEKSLCAKLSDMGIFKQIPRGLSSVENNFSGRGTLGWRAPELSTLDGVRRNVDLFSLGCIFFFCLTRGVCLFDVSPEFERTTRELGERFFMISHMPAAVDLIERLVSSMPDHRPKIEEVIKHPMLWDATTRLAFIRDASDRIKQAGSGSTLERRIENSRETIFRNGWDLMMDKNLIVEISKRRQYNYSSVSHLVRALRNTSVHYNELSNDVKKNFESKYPEGLDNYFTEKFPHLLFEVYKVICEVCAGEEVFERYIYES